VIAIIDYRAGNLASVKRALNQIGADAEITNNPSIVINAERIIFPGVGASGKAISDLKGLGLDRALVKAFDDGKPILGICLGTQIIMERSWENNTRCLGLIKGDVQRFPADLRDDKGQRLKVPHMGWNRVRIRTPHPLFEGIDPKNEFYFVHAYYPCPADKKYIVGSTIHGIDFVSAMGVRNLFAVQFHPEKSGRPGLKILSNFCQWDGKYHA